MRRYIDEYFEVPEEQTLKPSPEELKEIVLSKHNEGMTTSEIVRELQETLWLFNDETETEYEKDVVENIINNRPVRNRWTNIEVKPPTTKVAGFPASIIMTKEEIYGIYDEICKIVDGTYLYHEDYLVGSYNWNSDETSLFFTVYGHSDQGEGAEWEKEWAIDREGRIYDGETIHNSLEDFKNNW